MKSEKNKKGFSLLGAIIGLTVAAIILLAFTTLITKAITFNSANGQRLQATLYLQELIEVAKDLEQSPEISGDWNQHITDCVNQTCHPPPASVAAGSWELAIGEENLDDTYTRSLTIENVCRDTITNEILPPPCNPADSDPNTKKVIAQIDWNDRFGQAPLELEAYIYNYSNL